MAGHKCLAVAAAVALLLVLEELLSELWEKTRLPELWEKTEVRQLLRDVQRLRPSVGEPAGLQERLEVAIPRRQITEAEHRVLEKDGVLVLRGLVKDRKLLRELARGMSLHQQIHGAVFRQPWLYNGLARAFLRQVPIADLGADLLRATGPVKMREAPIWGLFPSSDYHHASSWHQDQVYFIAEQPLVTVWIALTEAPHSVEYLLGSHRFRAELLQQCNRSDTCEGGHRLLYHNCTMKFMGAKSLFAPDLRAGDAVAFDGNVTHRSIIWPGRRTAIAARFEHFFRVPTPCSNDEGAIIFRHDGQAVRPAGLDPLDCVGELVLPRPEEVWPSLRDWLPPSPLLRRFVRAATYAWFAVRSPSVE